MYTSGEDHDPQASVSRRAPHSNPFPRHGYPDEWPYVGHHLTRVRCRFSSKGCLPSVDRPDVVPPASVVSNPAGASSARVFSDSRGLVEFICYYHFFFSITRCVIFAGRRGHNVTRRHRRLGTVVVAVPRFFRRRYLHWHGLIVARVYAGDVDLAPSYAPRYCHEEPNETDTHIREKKKSKITRHTFVNRVVVKFRVHWRPRDFTPRYRIVLIIILYTSKRSLAVCLTVPTTYLCYFSGVVTIFSGDGVVFHI